MKQHKFTHIGKAPYTLISYLYDPPVQDTNGAWHGGQNSCDHCGRPISHVFICKSSDGKIFNLGSVHVEDLGDEGLTQAVHAKMTEVQKEARRLKNQDRWEKERIERMEMKKSFDEKMKNIYEEMKPVLQSRPHPNSYFASQGKTLLDYLNYFLLPESEYPNWNSSKVIVTLREVGGNI